MMQFLRISSKLPSTYATLLLGIGILILTILMRSVCSDTRIITSSGDGKNEYVQYKVSQPILEFDSSFGPQPQQQHQHQQSQNSQSSSVSFDGDVYYSNAKPFWETDEGSPAPQPPANNNNYAAASAPVSNIREIINNQRNQDSSNNIIYGKGQVFAPY